MSTAPPASATEPNAPEPTATGDRSATPPVRYRRAWLLAFLGFFLLGAAWAIATPYDGAPDERDHILRAYGVATGQVFLDPANAALGGGAFVDAPRSLMVPRCWQFNTTQDVSCAGDPGTDRTIERLPTSSGRNAPFYYAIVGGPLALWPDWTGVILARLLAVLASTLLLATALADTLRWGRHRLVGAGVIAAATPMELSLVGSINPNALEIAGAMAFFAAAIPLLLDPAARRNSTLLWHAGIGAVVLATVRTLGPFFLILAVLALLLPWRRATLKDLWGWHRLRWWVLGMAVAVLAGAGWTIAAGGTEANPYWQENAGYDPIRLVRVELQNWGRYVDEMVGITSWLDAHLPLIAYVVWPIVGGSLVLFGYVLARRGDRLRLGGLVVAAVGGPTAVTLAEANSYGFITQGRYLLPLLSGVVMLAAYTLDQLLAAEQARTLLRLVVVALLPFQVLGLVFTMRRWQLGTGYWWNLFDATWQPPLGPVPPILAAVVGVALLAWLLCGDQLRSLAAWRPRARAAGSAGAR